MSSRKMVLLFVAIVVLSTIAFFGGKTVINRVASSNILSQDQTKLQPGSGLNEYSSTQLNQESQNVSTNTSSTLAKQKCPPLSSRENAVFWYQPINSGDIEKFGCPKALVGNYSWTPQNLSDIKQSTGTEVYSYLEMFWLPPSGQFAGLDLSHVAGWKFCSSGDTPKLGNYSGSAHPTWYYVDLNSKAVIDNFKAYALQQKNKGFDGIFLDTGGQAMVYGKIWNKKSSCTRDPISTVRTAGDSFAKLVNALHSVGMKAFVNIGSPPDLSVPKFRPNPRRADCVAGQPSCVPMSDVMTNAEFVLNEGVSNYYDATDWQHTLEKLNSDQNVPLNPLRSHAVVVTMGRYKGPLDTTQQSHILYQWATMKLYDVAATFGTGDDNAGGNRFGIAPAGLVNIRFGEPLAMWGKPGLIGSSDGVHGIWYRRYQNGMIIVNNTANQMDSGRIPIFDGVTCKYIRTQPTNRLIGNGNCNASVNRGLKPYSAEVLTYSDKP